MILPQLVRSGLRNVSQCTRYVYDLLTYILHPSITYTLLHQVMIIFLPTDVSNINAAVSVRF